MTRSSADLVAEITSPEHVAFAFPLAGPATRTGAYFIDQLILFLPALIYLLVQDITLGPIGLAGLILLAQFPYFMLFEIWWNGQTPGKRICGLRVVSDDGLPINWQQVAIRNFLRPVDQLPGLYALGVAVMLIGSRWQRVGDLAAGTLVVLERPPTLPPPARAKATVHVPTCVLRNPEMRRTVLLYGVKRNRLGKALALELVRPLLDTLIQAGALTTEDDADAMLIAWYHRLCTDDKL